VAKPAASSPNILGRRRVLQLAGIATASVGVAGLSYPAAATPTTSWPGTGTYPADVAVQWFERLRQLVRVTPGFSPPVAARAYGHAGVALYQAVVPGMPRHRSLVGQLSDLWWTPGGAIERGQWPLVANAALAEITRRLFPTAPAEQRAAVDALEASLAESLGADVAPLWRRTARLRGYAVAAAVFEWSKSDGGHEAYLGLPSTYNPPYPPGYWAPTPPGYLPALLPTWGNNRTMVPGLVSRTLVDPPPPYPSSALHAAAEEVYVTGQNLTDEQRAIALFWADGVGTATPAGHWVSILSQYLSDIDARLDVAAEAYARLGIAVNDAFIACWNTKYTYHLLRPVTYVQRHIDPAWLPLTSRRRSPSTPPGTRCSRPRLPACSRSNSASSSSPTTRGCSPRSMRPPRKQQSRDSTGASTTASASRTEWTRAGTLATRSMPCSGTADVSPGRLPRSIA
jgi:hypothetical protein